MSPKQVMANYFEKGALYLVGLFLAGNLFFVKRLVDKIDSTESVVWQLRQNVVVLEVTVNNLKEQIKTRLGE